MLSAKSPLRCNIEPSQLMSQTSGGRNLQTGGKPCRQADNFISRHHTGAAFKMAFYWAIAACIARAMNLQATCSASGLLWTAPKIARIPVGGPVSCLTGYCAWQVIALTSCCTLMPGAQAFTSAGLASGLESDPLSLLLEALEAALAFSAFSASRSLFFLCSRSTISCTTRLYQDPRLCQDDKVLLELA